MLVAKFTSLSEGGRLVSERIFSPHVCVSLTTSGNPGAMAWTYTVCHAVEKPRPGELPNNGYGTTGPGP
jgi:hypothetical protein